jgi:hypothetical protein
MVILFILVKPSRPQEVVAASTEKFITLAEADASDSFEQQQSQQLVSESVSCSRGMMMRLSHRVVKYNSIIENLTLSMEVAVGTLP